MRSPVFHTVTRGFTPETTVATAPPTDALAAPSNDDLLTAALTMWPTGPAWGSPDGEAVAVGSVLERFTRVLVDGFAWLCGRAFRLAIEASPQGVSELLPEWERDHNLPEVCFPGDQTTTQRLAALAARVRAEPVDHPEDFIRVAAGYGFEIEIEEPCMFQCGFSECGGYHEAGDVAQEAYWTVRVRDAAVSYFECGASECGVDPLFDLGPVEQLLCLLRQLAPAWTLPLFAPWINFVPLALPDGTLIVDENGNLIVVPQA